MAKSGLYVLLALASLRIFAAGTEIADPVNFVSDVYKNYMANRKAPKPYLPPQDIYSPRLKRLLDEDRRKAKGEVDCIDFDFWVNGQDWRLSKLQVVSGKPPSPDQQVVVATFVSLGSAEEIHFDFVRIRGKWLLDDVHSMKGMPWTLSKLLSCWPQ